MPILPKARSPVSQFLLQWVKKELWTAVMNRMSPQVLGVQGAAQVAQLGPEGQVVGVEVVAEAVVAVAED